jgi:hypothetical protein
MMAVAWIAAATPELRRYQASAVGTAKAVGTEPPLRSPQGEPSAST